MSFEWVSNSQTREFNHLPWIFQYSPSLPTFYPQRCVKNQLSAPFPLHHYLPILSIFLLWEVFCGTGSQWRGNIVILIIKLDCLSICQQRRVSDWLIEASSSQSNLSLSLSLAVPADTADYYLLVVYEYYDVPADTGYYLLVIYENYYLL